jgi:hypothetical protein
MLVGFYIIFLRVIGSSSTCTVQDYSVRLQLFETKRSRFCMFYGRGLRATYICPLLPRASFENHLISVYSRRSTRALISSTHYFTSQPGIPVINIQSIRNYTENPLSTKERLLRDSSARIATAAIHRAG